MRLTRYTDYSLRVLMYLGLMERRRATITEISEAYGISRNHVMKVVYELGRLGYVQTVRGKHGGLSLARDPAAINLGAVVRATESDLHLVECFDEAAGHCALHSGCRLRGALERALNAFLSVLDEYTLAQLIEPRSELQSLLEQAGAPLLRMPVAR